MIETDICIIGAGPVGLFAVFEAGLLKMRCHLVDYLPQVGGQLSEIYPKKPIYDIPGYPTVGAQELVDNLMEQAKPFDPTFTLGERIEKIEKQEDNTFILTTHLDTKIHAKIICIAGGLGVFEPRKPALENLADYEKNGVEYMVLDPEKYRNKKIVIAGGGDSALDWTMFLADVAAELTMVHRGEMFRGAPDSVDKVKQLADEGKIKLELNSTISHLHGDGKLSSVTITNNDGSAKEVECDYYLALFGLSPKLGPIANWGLSIDKNAINVDTKDYSTNQKGIYAIGDINTYEGKLKLILCGFHEAAIMCHSAAELISGKKPSLKYTTVNGVNAF
ncbi:MAG: NAD(P)/FAD-dependent oxidoreductase [Chitinophagales bacterium]|nr:NAD(P)/FAD-dependent oxidoreductase [Saprospirales bacterium]MBK8351929.1 NAD(P)/FAD-dependent oxidoreductase [Saprospirales bacterium]MBP6659893.1 NAD(P)/FAD-dependent oxidoreductase [Chitinophagales bacterium]